MGTEIGRGLLSGHPWLLNVLTTLVRPFFATVEKGARNQLWAAFGHVRTGEYYEPVGKAGLATEIARDETKARELWDWTAREIKQAGFGDWP